MNTNKKDWLSVVLLAAAIAPVVMYATVGAAFMPDVLQASEPPMMIARLISKLSRTTGLSFAVATKVIFATPVVMAAILYAIRDKRRRTAMAKTKEQGRPTGPGE